LRVFNFICF